MIETNPSKEWHQQSPEEVIALLRSSESGLTAEEAAKRLSEGGVNELTEGKRISAGLIFLRQFKSLVIWILIVAGAVVGMLGETVEAVAILVIVVLNAVIGFYQEYGAEKSIAALKLMTAPKATVRRGNETLSIAASDVVAGDLIALVAGDVVASDARLIKAASLKCAEAALTGESEVVTKQIEALQEKEVPLGERTNLVFMGTGVASGTGLAVVVATGMKTELGRIAEMLEGAAGNEATPLQKRLASLGRVLIVAALGIVAVMCGLGFLRGMPVFELTMTSVSLAVAAVPEGLPAVVTVALALGVRRMSRRHALVRKLAAVETLGSTSVICTDKTGTLTVGEMTVRALFVDGKSYSVTGEGYGPTGEVLIDGQKTGAVDSAPLLELGMVLVACNDAQLDDREGTWITLGDPTEGALLVAGAKAGANREKIESEYERHHEIPFDSDRKRSAVVRSMPGGGLRAFVNGAPDILLKHCTQIYTAAGVRSLTDADRKMIETENAAMAKRALRVIGSAYHDLDHAPADELTVQVVEQELVFVGLSGMHDPPRQEAKEAVAKCVSAGIRVVMITGDHPQTAAAIANELGIQKSGPAVTGVELDAMGDEKLNADALNIAVYARVTAAHKLRIVRALRADGAVIAMTGDGVNDASAIKGADIGIAMGKSGTEVTRQAADMIITDDNFATIVSAIEEGRGIYDNIRKTLQYLLSGSVGELLLMLVCVIMGLPAPLMPIHLLWINLVTDGLPALCLATDRIDPEVMKRGPRDRSENITNESFIRAMLLTGFLTAGVAFGVYLYVLNTVGVEAARTHAFATLVFAELLRSFGARSQSKPLWRVPFSSNIPLVVVLALSFSLQVWSQHGPALGGFLKTSYMPFTNCLLLLALGAIPTLVLEMNKAFRAPKE